MNLYSKLIISLALCLQTLACISQTDAHYWTHQYGAKGLLLNGAVIASPSGETSLFYNPGSMGLDDNLGFAFSFLTPTYSNLKTSNLLGDGSSIEDRSVNLSPGFLGIRFRPFNSKSLTVGVSQFKRYKTDINYEDRVINQVNGLSDYIFRADLDFNRQVSEDWIGFGLAVNVGDNIGLGLSQFSVWHSQNTNIDLKKEILLSNDPLSTIQSWRYQSDYGFSLSSGFITKLGFSFKAETVNFGLTYTSPLYGILYRSGSYSLEEQIIDNVNEKFSSTSNRNNTDDITYKTPHSVGLGIDIHSQTTAVSITAEYFSRINEYYLIQEIDDSFDGLSQIPNETSFDLESKNEGVLNFAIGIQKETSEQTTWVFGFRTDFNQNTRLGINNNPGYFGVVGDVFHITGGNMLNLKKNQFSAGLDFGWGKKTGGQQLVDLSIVDPSTVFTFSEQENVESRFYSIMLFITYDFIFKRFSSDK